LIFGRKVKTYKILGLNGVSFTLPQILKFVAIFALALSSFLLLFKAHIKQKSHAVILENLEVVAKPANIAQLPDLPLIFEEEVKAYKARKGDSFNSVFKKIGVKNTDIYHAVKALFKVSKKLKLQVNNSIYAYYDSFDDGRRRLKKIEIYVDNTDKFDVVKKSNGKFVAYKSKIELISKLHVKSGRINSSLYQDAIAANIPVEIILKFIDLYSFDLDFQRDIRKNDKFQIFYEAFYNKRGKLVKTGDILFCKFVNQGQALINYKYTTSQGKIVYLNQDGSSVKRTLLKTPISGARISSNYGYRRHPILGYTKLHSGIDFAARTGTPIYAAGDGVVKVIKWYGGYGRYIKIRHNSKYSTAYGHMSRFKRGLRRGHKVKQGQVIGYVGSTGRSTGPHLHYEVHKRGKSINPKNLKTQSKITLKKKELQKFMQHKKRISFILTNAFAMSQI
jgi:murein DD-endopeptidase MepM/ murein hydrolase activator NlpD